MLPQGFLLILSGNDMAKQSYAGVGFIVAPHVRRSIITFKLESERMCMLKLRTVRGKVVLLSAYAPPQTPNHPIDERQSFFQSLSKLWSESSCNGPRFLLGDLNSRLYKRLPGEEAYIGESFVEHQHRQLHADMNRFQLMQLCAECDLQIVNTFTDHSLSNLVTYKEIGYVHGSNVTSTNHELLDLILAPRTQAHRIANLSCIKEFALKSHHYLVIADLDVDLTKATPGSNNNRINVSLLRQPHKRAQFINIVEQELEAVMQTCDTQDTSSLAEGWSQSFHTAAQLVLGPTKMQKKKPWISDRTLDHISKRNEAKFKQDPAEEARRNKLIKHSVKQDRADWFHDMLRQGDWKAIQKFRKSRSSNFSKMRNAHGKILFAHERAEGLAQHLETVQWAVRPETIPSD